MSARLDITPSWIAIDCDVDTLHFWAMDAANSSLDYVAAPHQPDHISAKSIASELLTIAAHWSLPLRCPVIISGALNAARVSTPTSANCTPTFEGQNANLDLWTIPNIIQSAPADMMQGTEAQVAGFLALNPEWDGVICCPGPHTKWVHVSAGEVVSFCTFLTGELRTALSQNTVLRTCALDEENEPSIDEKTLQATLSRPERLAQSVYGLFASSHLETPADNLGASQLYSILIGAELAAAKPFWLGQRIAVLTGTPIAELYMQALTIQAAFPEACDQTAAKLAGFTTAFQALSK